MRSMSTWVWIKKAPFTNLGDLVLVGCLELICGMSQNALVFTLPMSLHPFLTIECDLSTAFTELL